MKHSVRSSLLGLVVLFGGFMAFPAAVPQAYAAEPAAASDAEKEKIRAIVKEVMREYAATLNEAKQAQHGGAGEIIGDIRNDNQAFVRSHKPAYFKPFLDSQHPRATVITCSDSRVHTHALDASPDGDLFMVRNIGNQVATAEGSVEYGVHHLHTPLLLIVGHSACGAVKAASGDYSKESPAIKRELDTLQVPKGDPGMGSIKLNVNAQVRVAMTKFEPEVMGGHLTVVGAVYDFTNELKQGQGKLNIINVNGETNPAKIAALEMLKEAPAAKPKAASHRPAAKKAAAKEAETEEDSAPAEDKPGKHEKPAKKASH
jgi:carbonic anhydrase